MNKETASPTSSRAFTLTNSRGTLTIEQAGYRLVIVKRGFRFSIERSDGTPVVGAHPVAGLAFTDANGSELQDVFSTRFVSSDTERVILAVTTSLTTQARVIIYPRPSSIKLQIIPRRPSRYTIDVRTAPLGPVYGLGDHGGYAPGDGPAESANRFGIASDDFHNTDNRRRFVSNFAVFPAQGFAQVLFETGRKRVFIDDQQNCLGAANVPSVEALYFFVGDMARIYRDYRDARLEQGYREFQPRYALFGLGYESWGSLGWDTYQSSVTTAVQEYLDRGYRLKWGVVGSGFWKGGRRKPDGGNNERQGATTSFGIWDDTYDQAGRFDDLPNPRYPDPAALKAFFRDNSLALLLGLRISFKALPQDGGFYDEINDGPWTPEGFARGYFIKDADGRPRTFTATFPAGPTYLLDRANQAALDWFERAAELWGADGFKEDTMLADGSQLYDDAKLNAVNERLVERGRYVIVRNGAYSVPGNLARIEDANYRGYNSDKDRTVINALNYAASAAPNVYPDIVGGGGLREPLGEDEKKYLVRNAIFCAVCPAMSMGFAPWRMNAPAYEANIREAAAWHSRFAPYIHSAAIDAFATGYPHTMTPLPVAFPDDPNTYYLATTARRQYQWMLGPSMLAAPIYGNDFATAMTRDIYLPAGRWIDPYTGDVYQGPVTLEKFYLPPERMPVFIGGKGVVVYGETDEMLFAQVYPVSETETVYTFTFPDGESTSTITGPGLVGAGRNVVVLDETGGVETPFIYEEKTASFAFELTPGHSYRLLRQV